MKSAPGNREERPYFSRASRRDEEGITIKGRGAVRYSRRRYPAFSLDAFTRICHCCIAEWKFLNGVLWIHASYFNDFEKL